MLFMHRAGFRIYISFLLIKKKKKRFEATWLSDDRCFTVIETVWNEHVGGSEFIKLCKKQESTRDALRKWNKDVFDNCQNKINSLLQSIKAVQQKPPSNNTEAIEAALQIELLEWLLRSETLFCA